MFYSFKGQVPAPIPHRILLSSGLTRTDASTFTPEEILDAGYIQSQRMPQVSDTQVVTWDMQTVAWQIRDKTPEELAAETQTQWNRVRAQRDSLMSEHDWMYARYQRELRLGLPHAVTVESLDVYMQALADITQQSDPFAITWPEFTGGSNGT